MTSLTEQTDAIEEYLRVLRYSEDGFRETLASLSRTLKRGDTGDDAFIASTIPVDVAANEVVIIATSDAFAGLLDAEAAEKTGPLRTALIVYTADEAIKALAEAVNGSDRVSAGDEISGFPVSEHIRAVANSHRHSREWRSLVVKAEKGDEDALHKLRKNHNQPRLKALLATPQWVAEPCGLALVSRLCDADLNARDFDIDRLMERLRSVARDLCVSTFGSTEAYDDALIMISDEEAYRAMDIQPIA
jgi:hypothetical protein